MIWSVRPLCRVALATCVAVIYLAAPRTPPTAANAAGGSAWYWQNPVPRNYGINAVACRSVTACVAVGLGGSIVTTADGGQHWTERRSGTTAFLERIACPGHAAWYAAGLTNTPYSQSAQLVILKSADGGTTWRQVSTHIAGSPYTFVSSLACPSEQTCLLGGSNGNPGGSNAILRTTDGATTWQLVHIQGLVESDVITCATTTICYAAGIVENEVRLLWSVDGGQTWRLRGSQNPTGLSAMVCPAAEICFAIAQDCGGECNLGHIYVSRDGARTWKRVHDGAAGDIDCPTATTCYASADQSVLRTTNSGQTWSVRRLPSQPAGLTCPGPATCYLSTLFGLLKTSDGFGHTQETLYHSVVHNQTLTDISCPTTTSCYVAGSRNACPLNGPCDQVPASFAATTDGGRTWRTTPQTPDLLERLSCPRVSVCFAVGGTDPSPIALDRSDDGAVTWHQTRWQQISNRLLSHNQASDITCVAATTCYVLATVGETPPGNSGPAQRLAVLVTHDTGRSWSVQTEIDTAARTGSTGPPNLLMLVTPNRISCPSVTTCFVLATIYHVAAPGHPDEQVVILSSTDGGKNWTRHLTVPGTVPDSGYAPLGQDLSCPTTTTCYLLSFTQNPEASNPNGLPGPVLVTHDAGATWRSSVVSSGEYLMAINCTTSQSCRVAGTSGISTTVDGGTTWQPELLADGSKVVPMISIACPAVHTCYSVGGPEPCCAVMIVATHPSGTPRPLARGSIRFAQHSYGPLAVIIPTAHWIP